VQAVYKKRTEQKSENMTIYTKLIVAILLVLMLIGCTQKIEKTPEKQPDSANIIAIEPIEDPEENITELDTFQSDLKDFQIS
jgi:outer membrane biogenesis lipoprotein LolB